MTLLKDHELPYRMEDVSPSLDITFANSPLNKRVDILIPRSAFSKAESILGEEAHGLAIEQMPKDYYLRTFTKEELIDVVMKPDEWSAVDYEWARELLAEMEVNFDDASVTAIRERRNKQLAKPRRSKRSWVFAGYFLAVVGGLLGIFVGWQLMATRKTTPDGSRHFLYHTDDRKHGRNIVILGLGFFLLYLALFFQDAVIQ